MFFSSFGRKTGSLPVGANFNAFFTGICTQCKIGDQQHSIFRGSCFDPLFISPQRKAKQLQSNSFLLSGVSVGFRRSTAQVGGKRVLFFHLHCHCRAYCRSRGFLWEKTKKKERRTCSERLLNHDIYYRVWHSRKNNLSKVHSSPFIQVSTIPVLSTKWRVEIRRTLIYMRTKRS